MAYKSILSFLIGISILMLSCTQEEISLEPSPSFQNGYMKIHLKTPDLRTPTVNTPVTRSMNNWAENAIDKSLLNVLVFKCNGDEDEIFCYRTPISGSIRYDENDGSKAEITIKLVESTSSDDQYRIVVIANHNLADINLIKDVTSKTEVLEQLTYSLSEKWNAGTDNYSPFPMWGENMPVSISDGMEAPVINLYRALARVDVGLNFTVENGKLTEQSEGLANFKIKEILVYRTYDKGYVAPLNVDFTTTPNVPADAERHEDTSPLSYTIPDAGGADKYVREIYIPEADLPSSPDNDNTHCIVVGGYYKNSSVVSYYRLDFATENTGNRSYLPVLRNHRYTFNITQVRGPGATSAQAALKTHGTIENLGYDLIVWDETIHEMDVQGKYYFGLDNRSLLFEAQSTANDPSNLFSVKYNTNYPLSVGDPLTLNWTSILENPLSTPRFDAQWQMSDKSILIKANTNNTTGGLFSDTLLVSAGPFVMKITVQQKCLDLKYSLACTSINVNGIYKRDITLDTAKHSITLSIIADSRDMQGLPYVIETVDPLNHGISFRAEGTFDFSRIPQGQPLRIDNIRMAGSGTIQADEDENMFSLSIVSNSPSGSSCEATIQLVIPHMNILVLAHPDKDFGYAISDGYSGANKIFNSPDNFGPKDNSIIKVEGFSFISSTVFTFESFGTGNLYKWITGIGNDGKIADIVYLANYAKFNNNTTVELLVNYMDKGGVVVIFNEESSVQHLANAVLKVNNISSVSSGQGGSVYPFPAHSYFGLNENGVQNVLRQFESDPILNGPFGDVRDKQWGEDVNSTMNLTNMPSDPNLTIYSYYADISRTPPSANINYVNGFKYESENRNMIWFGDGGFMASYEGNIAAINTSCPLSWNLNTFFPEPRFGYGVDNRMPVYNSTVFCNIMAWAVLKSESLRAKRNK